MKFEKKREFVLTLTFITLSGFAAAQNVSGTFLQPAQTSLEAQNPGAVQVPVPAPGEASVPSCDKYVSLANDEVLFGKISFNSIRNMYEIQVNAGLVSLPPTQVVQVADSLEEIYAFRARNVLASNVDGRCDLIRWCLRYGLFPQAETEIRNLSQLAPTHPMLDVFRRRLDTERQLAERQAQGANLRMSVDPSLGEIVAQPATGPSPVELKRLAESLPPDSIEIYRKHVQPVLAKNCMTGECHGPNSITEFRLGRVSPSMSRIALLRNIYFTLEQVNLSEPQASPLLRKPVVPHGEPGQERQIFVNSQYKTYQILIAWTYLVARNEYVIPREELIPPLHMPPTYTPTQRGLQRISSAMPESAFYNMRGVDASLLPQFLYPENYPAQPVYTAAPILRVAPPEEVPGSGEVQPASGELPENADTGIVPVNAEEPSNVSSWQELTPGEEGETADEIPEFDASSMPTSVRPPRRVVPGASSPNVQRGSARPMVAPSPVTPNTPMSPMQLLLGGQSTTQSSGNSAYNYQASGTSSGTSSAPANSAYHPWEYGLQLEKAQADFERAQNPEK